MMASRVAVSGVVVAIAVVVVMTAAVFTPTLMTMTVISLAWRWGTTPHSLSPDTHRVVLARAEAVLGSGSCFWGQTLFFLPHEVSLLHVQSLSVLLREAVRGQDALRAREGAVPGEFTDVFSILSIGPFL